MIEHVSLRCSDAKASRAFYEKALTPLGYRLSKRYGDSFGFIQGGRHDFWVTAGEVGTPSHVAFHAEDRGAVDAFYEAAIAAGGKDNGRPGVREDYGYAAFVLDPDGHNVEAVIWKEEDRTGSKRVAPRASARRAKAAPRKRTTGPSRAGAKGPRSKRR